jgi:hypothetical protein
MPVPYERRSTGPRDRMADELWDNVAGGTPRRIVEGRQIFLLLDLLGSRSLRQSCPAIERCLLASAAIRLASTATPSPPTRPAAMHALKTRSNMWRKTSPSRKRSLRARENAE